MKMNLFGFGLDYLKVDFGLVLPPLKCGLGFATLIYLF